MTTMTVMMKTIQIQTAQRRKLKQQITAEAAAKRKQKLSSSEQFQPMRQGLRDGKATYVSSLRHHYLAIQMVRGHLLQKLKWQTRRLKDYIKLVSTED